MAGGRERRATPRETLREKALTAFLHQQTAKGFTVETRSATQAIIARTRRPLLRLLPGSGERQVVSVDEHGAISTTEAEPRRS
jgi:translation initiation factor IF-1